MPASNTAPTAENRFAALSPACLSKIKSFLRLHLKCEPNALI